MKPIISELKSRIDYIYNELSTLDFHLKEYENKSLRLEESRRCDGMYDVYLIMGRDIPIGIKSKTGMIANELRACLDSLAVNLAIKNGRSGRDVYFPISRTEQAFLDEGIKKIRTLSDIDKQKIIEIKPYGGENDLLFGLHELDRTRKHIRISVLSAQNDTIMAAGGFINARNGAIIKLKNIAISGPNGEASIFFDATLYSGQKVSNSTKRVKIAEGLFVKTQLNIRSQIVFDEPKQFDGKPIVPTLRSCADRILEIVSSFEDAI